MTDPIEERLKNPSDGSRMFLVLAYKVADL